MTLDKESCTSCKADAPRVSAKEAKELLKQLPGWSIVKRGGEARLEKSFEFKDFQKALDFSNKIGRMAQKQDHHPALLTEWGSVTVTWWTHKIRGLHRNDFVAAAKTEKL